MNKKQKLQVSLAAFLVVYIIVLLFLFPGWKASKILGVLSGVFTLLALYISYRSEEKNKNNIDN
ncbi:MAG: hypothetical protein K5893_00560 [Prevotella sp.]|nr:hypothetical protein [Prevotella sp.]